MKKGGGKIKGGAYERLICKQLSLWASNNEREDIFARSAMSGGRATVQRKKGVTNKTQCCDISAIDPLGSYLINIAVVECKNYKDLKLENLIFKTSKDGILQFWNEVVIIANLVNKEPWLIARQNGKKDILTITENNKNIICSRYPTLVPIAYFSELNMCIYYLTTFLKNVSYSYIKELNEKIK